MLGRFRPLGMVLLNSCKEISLEINTAKTNYMKIVYCRVMMENEHRKDGRNKRFNYLAKTTLALGTYPQFSKSVGICFIFHRCVSSAGMDSGMSDVVCTLAPPPSVIFFSVGWQISICRVGSNSYQKVKTLNIWIVY